MAELKHIGEVEQVVEVQENDNLIGERYGRAVRIPTNKVIPEGMVKSVNGSTPDSEGNVDLPTTIPSVQTAQVGQTVVVKAVDENGKPTEWEAADAGSQADWNEMDESKTSFVKNRTHWAETEYLIQWEWDGSTEGQTVAEFPDGGICVYISDITDPAVLIGAVCTFDMNGTKMSATFSDGDFAQIAESFYAGQSPFGLATNDNVELNGAVFPKAGLYYSIASGNTDVFSLTITKETVHQLDPKFIPNTDIFLVTADAHWDGMNETYTYDKTFQEIIDAVKAGMTPVLKMWDYTSGQASFNCWMYYLTEIIPDSLIRFKAIAGSTMKCTVNNEWTNEN